MAKTDPKDDRIAELELALKSANEATTKAEQQSQQIGALESALAERDKTIQARDAKIVLLEEEVRSLKSASQAANQQTVKNLPKNAVQLARTCVVTNSLTKTPIYPVTGDILVAVSTQDELAKAQAQVGSAHKVHPVDEAEIEAAKKSGRAY